MERPEVGSDDLGLVGKARSAWSSVGSRNALTLDAVELWWVEIPFRHPVTTATTTYAKRPLVLAKVAARAGDTPVDGWGECAALGNTDYVDEDAASAFGTLEQLLAPTLIDAAARSGGRLAPHSRLAPLRARVPHAPMAFATLEMAVADAQLRLERRSLASVLGVEGRSVEAGAVVGTFPGTPELVEAVDALVEVGYRRLKVKIAPGWDIEPLEAITTCFPSLRVQADANGSYVEGHADHLKEFDRFALLCLEQPYPAGELAAHVRLAARLRTPICLDESLHTPADVAEAVATGACSVVEVKPARLGGIGAALEVIESSVAIGVPMWIGGMFESRFARGVNAALAALPGFAWPGDLSPPGTYLAADVVPAIGSHGSALPEVSLPPGPGMGPAPDPTRLERHRIRHVVLPASGP